MAPDAAGRAENVCETHEKRLKKDEKRLKTCVFEGLFAIKALISKLES